MLDIIWGISRKWQGCLEKEKQKKTFYVLLLNRYIYN